MATVGRFAGSTFDARNRAKEGINGVKLTVGHVLKVGPGHDLQQSTVERKRKAIRGDRRRTTWYKRQQKRENREAESDPRRDREH